MLSKTEKPYVIYLAEVIYKNISDIKKNNSDISNIDAVEGFIGTKIYNEISSGKFHDNWFKYLENNSFNLMFHRFILNNQSTQNTPDVNLKVVK